MRTRIKFCGITRAADASAAAALGVDALGFVLVPSSPRFIEAEAAAMIRRQLPPLLSTVALFMNAARETVHAAIAVLQPSLLQFHGDEDADYCMQFGLPYLKAVAMRGAADPAQAAAAHPRAAGLLLDGHGAGEPGGQGARFDWQRAQVDCALPLLLAGGLNAGNVGRAIKVARPYAVDVSSGIESAPGIKDINQMRTFVDEVRRADAQQ